NAAIERIQRAAGIFEPIVQNGSFLVMNGTLMQSDATESKRQLTKTSNATLKPVALDQVIADDLIVQGSECLGLDCVVNESFGFDTLRLKENNTRIKFQDTSTSAGFPTHDWQ